MSSGNLYLQQSYPYLVGIFLMTLIAFKAKPMISLIYNVERSDPIFKLWPKFHKTIQNCIY